MGAGPLAISTASPSFKQEEEEDERIENGRKSRVPSGPGVGRRSSRS